MELKENTFFHGLDGFHGFRFQHIIRQVCKVDTCCLYLPDDQARKKKHFTKQEGPNEPTDEMVNQCVTYKAHLYKVTQLVLTIFVM